MLEALGLPVDLPPAATVRLVKEIGFGFFFAPRYHPAMRFAAPVRKQLGIPTVFNFLGPLANPARASRMALGVADPRMAERMIGVLQAMGRECAFVFYGEDGLDELTTAGTSFIYRLKDGEITHAEYTPSDFGVAPAATEDLLGGDAEQNAMITRGVLDGEPGPRRDVAVVNALPGIVVAGLADGFADALPFADASFDRIFSSFMFHHLDGDVKRGALREAARVLHPGGSLHLLDFGGSGDHSHGLLGWLFHRSEQLRDNLEGRIPGLIEEAGFEDVAQLGRRSTIFGSIAFHRGARS